MLYMMHCFTASNSYANIMPAVFLPFTDAFLDNF